MDKNAPLGITLDELQRVARGEDVELSSAREKPPLVLVCERDHCTPEERAVLSLAIVMFEAEREADAEGGNTITRTAAFLRMQQAQKGCRSAVANLLAARAKREETR